mmetsp:Transcript_17795/g.25673  ORF Transcript_17795/g.25673 Transcript_17795/m.25673 type:complete len:252 (+) Transcript_17795:1789-2544(+)
MFNNMDASGFEGMASGDGPLYSDVSISERDAIVDAFYDYAALIWAAEDQVAEGETTTPSPTPSPTPTPSPEPIYFPGSATVQLESGEMIRMDQVAVGVKIRTSAGFSSVFMMGHKDSEILAGYVSFKLANGEFFAASASHYLKTEEGSLRAAGDFAVGDKLVTITNGAVTIDFVERVVAKGAFNPNTEQGDVVVNGVLASCYTTIVPPVIAAWLLMPFRILFRLGCTVPDFLHTNSSNLVIGLHKIAKRVF